MNAALQAKINSIAEKYFAAVTEEKRETLKIKLFDECLRMKLGAGADDNINDLYMKQDEKVDGLVLVEVFNDTLKVFNPAKGVFVNLFNRIYKFRNTEANAKEAFAKNTAGLKITLTKLQKNLRCDFNKLMKTSDCFIKLNLSARRLEAMSYQEIAAVGKYFGFNEAKIKELEIIAEICQPKRETLNYINNESDEQENIRIAKKSFQNYMEVENNKLSASDISKWLTEVLGNSSPVQGKYFICFITQRLYNKTNLGLLSDMSSVVDKDLLRAVFEKGLNEITDKFIADYLGVGKGAVSKQKAKFRELVKNMAAGIIN